MGISAQAGEPTGLARWYGQGSDEFSESAREKIRQACGCPQAAVQFLVGGTQVNATMIDGLLRLSEGVIAADSGHVAVHEAGAIELGGHKVLTIPHESGRLTAEGIGRFMEAFLGDGNHEHMVQPALVYLSQPTEYGTLYSLAELEAIREVCDRYGLLLYVDGARLADALGCAQNDVSLADLGRLCDAFYIGGTKCGALLGEAAVLPDPGKIPHFFTMIKQHGALLAKGRLLGLSFDTLFTDGLYETIGAHADACADVLREAFERNGYTLCFGSPTNQVFVLLENAQMERLSPICTFSFWEAPDEDHTIVRLATSWATRMDEVQAFARELARI